MGEFRNLQHAAQQGDQIVWFFAYWVIVYFRQLFSKIAEGAQIFTFDPC
jgi:hypothetical protein